MSQESQDKRFESAIARIYYKDTKQVIGAGFLVTQQHLLTCAHVVIDALGIKEEKELLNEVIELDFPFIAPGTIIKAKVIFWSGLTSQKGEDIAGLELQDTPPNSANPVQLIYTLDLQNHNFDFQIFGFPKDYDYNGRWSFGKIHINREDAFGLVQIHTAEKSYQIEPGYSGSAVWFPSLQAAVGMVVERVITEEDDNKRAFMISATVLLESWSFLSLIQVLTANLDTAINSAIQTAYKSCCSRGNLPTTVEGIVKDLYDLDKRSLDSNIKFNHNDNTAQFIKYLITNSQIPQTKLENLKKWGSNNIEDFDKLIQNINKRDINTDTILESYILIKIEPLKTKSRSKIPKFKISGGVIPDGQNQKDFIKIDVSDSPNDSFTLEKIREKLNLILTEKITVPLQKDINLIFFLPTEMLNHPVEQWIITENGVSSPLGKKYRVIIRDYNRLLPQYLKNQGIWLSKWDQRDKNKVCEKIFETYRENHDPENLLEILNNAIGIIITAFSDQEYKEIFGYFLNSATPIGICYRYNNQFSQFSDCLQCSVFDLPEIVKKERLKSRTEDPNHIGHHISLIWEDPNIKPTNFHY